MSQHRSFLLLPDPKLTGRDSIQSATSEGGRVPGRGVPSSENEGNLSAFVSGRALSDDASFDLRIQTSGGIVAGATYAWRYRGEPDADWRGSNDRRFIHAQSDPFMPSGSFSLPVTVGRTAILVSTILGKEFCYSKSAAGSYLDVRWRSVGEAEGSWTSAVAVFAGGIDYSGSNVQFAGCVLPDGGFRMIVFRDNDLDIYGSEDGLSWTRIANNIHSRFAGRLLVYPEALQLVESGGYLMALFAEDQIDGSVGISRYITFLVSSDRGATWTEIDSGVLPANAFVSRYGPAGNDRFAITACGVGDAAGSFLLAVRSSISPTNLAVLYRSGLDSWSTYQSGSLGAYAQFDRLLLGRTSTHIVLLFVDLVSPLQRTSVSGEFGVSVIDRRLPLANQSFTDVKYFTGFDAFGEFRLGMANLVWNGSSLAVFGKRYSWQTGAEEDGSIYFRLGEAWSKAPISDSEWEGWSVLSGRSVGYQPIGPLFDAIEWFAEYGLPDSAPSSPWTLSASGGVCSWRGDRAMFAAPVGSYVLFQYGDPSSVGSAPTTSWLTSSSTSEIGGSLIVWESQGVVGGSTITNEVGVRVVSRDPLNFGRQMDLTVRMSLTAVSILDSVSGSTIGTITPSTAVYGSNPFTARWEFRWAFCPRPNGAGRLTVLMCRRVGDSDWLFTSPAAFAFRTISLNPSFNQYVWFGILGSTTAPLTDWRFYSLRIHEAGDLRQAVQFNGSDPVLDDDTRPQVVRGCECSTFPISLADGVEVAWGGGGGFDGDLFESVLSFQYGAENLFLGPRFEWRSDDTPSATESVVIRAGSEDHSRFRHDAVAVFGSNAEFVDLEYDDDPAFPSPTAFSLSLRRFDDLVVSSVDGTQVSVTGTTLPADGEVASSDARSYYAKVVSAAPGSTSVSDGDVFRISAQRESTLDLDSGVFLPAVVGSTLSIFADRGVKLLGSTVTARYLRVSPTGAAAPAEPYRIGSVVAGSTLPMDIPLEWEHSDSDSPTATEYRSRSGISWAYIEGPPRRSVSGTVVGDAGTFRARLRNLLRSTSRYAERPIVLAMDESDLTNPETVMLVRTPGGVDFDQTGWRYLEDEDRWIPVGDASVEFEQDV